MFIWFDLFLSFCKGSLQKKVCLYIYMYIVTMSCNLVVSVLGQSASLAHLIKKFH